MVSLTAGNELAGEDIVVSLIYPQVMATNFQKNLRRSKLDLKRLRQHLPGADPSERVAAKILEVVLAGAAETMVGSSQ